MLITFWHTFWGLSKNFHFPSVRPVCLRIRKKVDFLHNSVTLKSCNNIEKKLKKIFNPLIMVRNLLHFQ